MPGYTKKQLQKYSLYPSPTKKYGKTAKIPSQKAQSSNYPRTRHNKFNRLYEILNYAQAVNITLFIALNTVASDQSKATEFTINIVE